MLPSEASVAWFCNADNNTAGSAGGCVPDSGKHMEAGALLRVPATEGEGIFPGLRAR